MGCVCVAWYIVLGLFVKYGLCMCGVVVLGHLSLLPTVFLFVKYGFCMCGVVYSIGTLC